MVIMTVIVIMAKWIMVAIARASTEFEKADEIYFRLGIIYKQQQKYQQSLDVSHRRARKQGNSLNADISLIVLPTYIAQPSKSACKR
jgi:hypothetical protein